jgi:redox-sensing transcriptional repressor
MTPIQVRKDLESIGAKGRPKIGYSKNMLIKLIAVTLGYENVSEAFLVGIGNLGKALLSYKMFKEYGLDIIAGFDTDSDLIGLEINNKPIFSINKFKELTNRMKIKIGIIAVPVEDTQKVADIMIEAAIEAIWNFAPMHIKAPKDIIIQNVNMASSLAVLSNKLKEKENKVQKGQGVFNG